MDVWTDYDDQYVMLTARKGVGGMIPDDREALKTNVQYFKERVGSTIAEWKQVLSDGKKTAIWGGGSKYQCRPPH